MQNVRCKMQSRGSAFFILHLTFCILHFLVSSPQRADCAEPQLLPQELLDQGWISLFDGQTLFGWEPVGDAKWEVVDGEIRTEHNDPYNVRCQLGQW